MLLSLIFNLIKSLFGISTKDDSHLTDAEKRIFNKNLNVRNKEDILERIDYWIEKNNFDEARKLSALYIKHNGSDEMVSQRLSMMTK